MSNELKELTQKTIYDIYEKEYPAIVRFIKAALKSGKTSEQISLSMEKFFGKQNTTSNHIWLVAEHLKTLNP